MIIVLRIMAASWYKLKREWLFKNAWVCSLPIASNPFILTMVQNVFTIKHRIFIQKKIAKRRDNSQHVHLSNFGKGPNQNSIHFSRHLDRSYSVLLLPLRLSLLYPRTTPKTIAVPPTETGEKSDNVVKWIERCKPMPKWQYDPRGRQEFVFFDFNSHLQEDSQIKVILHLDVCGPFSVVGIVARWSPAPTQWSLLPPTVPQLCHRGCVSSFTYVPATHIAFAHPIRNILVNA